MGCYDFFGNKSLIDKESRSWINHIGEYEMPFDAFLNADSGYSIKYVCPA